MIIRLAFESNYEPIGFDSVPKSGIDVRVWLFIIDLVKLSLYSLFNKRKAALGENYQSTWEQLKARS